MKTTKQTLNDENATARQKAAAVADTVVSAAGTVGSAMLAASSAREAAQELATVKGYFQKAQCPDAGQAASGGGVSTNSNPLEEIEYTQKVKAQMQIGDYHSFPESVDAFGKDGIVTEIIGGDGKIRTKIEIQGSYDGKNGVFQYIIEPDGTCNHRLFVPNK